MNATGSDVSFHALVMAKAPIPGRVKTRLCPPCTPTEAAAVAEAALVDTLGAVAACGADRKIVALDGEAGSWLPPGFEVIAQRGESFGDRLANAWSAAGAWGIQIGMDTPQVTASLLDDHLALLDRRLVASSPRRAVLGPASDGGWWLLGLAGSDPRPVFSGIRLSRRDTFARQRDRLRMLGHEVVLGAELRDIDTAGDLVAVAAEIPESRLAAAARAVFSPGVPISGRTP